MAIDPTDIRSNPFKGDFPLLAASPELSYLDSAATCQRPACVLDAQRTFYETSNANPLRGLYDLSERATEAVVRARRHVAEFLGDGTPRPGATALDAKTLGSPIGQVVFCRNATEALNLVAASFAPLVLRPGDEVAVTVMEHHSNLIPWQQAAARAGATLVVLEPDANGLITPEEIEAKIGPKTRIVACCHVSNVLGVESPVAALAQAVHSFGGYLAVDAAQSAGHLPVRVADLGADFLAFSAHKAYGPMGIGVLWGRSELLERMPPALFGGEMVDTVTLKGATWAPSPQRFEAGTPDAAGIAALDASLSYIEGIGLDAIQKRETNLMEYAVARLEEIGKIDEASLGATLVGPAPAGARHGALAFNLRGVHPHDVAAMLAESGVAIRAGNHCAQPLMRWMGVPACCRASFGVYNDAADVDRMVEGLLRAKRVFG